MAAEVSSLLRILNAHKEENLLNEPTTVLITRDLLGSCSKAASANLDLDLQVPTGWEKRLDSKSCKSASPKSKKSAEKGREPPLRDLNVPPPPPLNLLEESCLELKLLPSSQYQSVCTLDKVKSALERAEKETSKKRSPPISLSSSLTTREEEEDDDDDDDEEEKRSLSLSPSSTPPTASSGMFAAGCPGCLLYVMTCMKNPNCPRCHSVVPSPSAFKKPRTRIDLNASF